MSGDTFGKTCEVQDPHSIHTYKINWDSESLSYNLLSPWGQCDPHVASWLSEQEAGVGGGAPCLASVPVPHPSRVPGALLLSGKLSGRRSEPGPAAEGDYEPV